MDHLIEQAQRGNRDAISSLVKEHYASVYRFCARRLGEELAKDAAQETFITMQKSLRKFERKSAFETWLFGIANNSCRNIARKRKAEPYSIENWMDVPGPSEHKATEDRATLRGALIKLSDEHREVVLMHEVEEMTYSEIAEILGIPVGTVKSRLYHAFVALRRSMAGVTV